MEGFDLASLATFFGGLALIGGSIFVNWKTGGNKAMKATIDSLITQVEVLNNEVKSLKERLEHKENENQQLQNEISMLKGQNEEKDKRIEDLTKIFQNRNPEMEKFITEVMDALRKSQPLTAESKRYMVDTSAVFTEMRDLLKKIDADNQAKKKQNETIIKQYKVILTSLENNKNGNKVR